MLYLEFERFYFYGECYKDNSFVRWFVENIGENDIDVVRRLFRWSGVCGIIRVKWFSE